MRSVATNIGCLCLCVGLVTGLVGGILWLRDFINRHPPSLPDPGPMALGGLAAFAFGITLLAIVERTERR